MAPQLQTFQRPVLVEMMLHEGDTALLFQVNGKTIHVYICVYIYIFLYIFICRTEHSHQHAPTGALPSHQQPPE